MPVLVEETPGAEKAKKPRKKAAASQTVTSATTSEQTDEEHYEEQQGQYQYPQHDFSQYQYPQPYWAPSPYYSQPPMIAPPYPGTEYYYLTMGEPDFADEEQGATEEIDVLQEDSPNEDETFESMVREFEKDTEGEPLSDSVADAVNKI